MKDFNNLLRLELMEDSLRTPEFVETKRDGTDPSSPLYSIRHADPEGTRILIRHITAFSPEICREEILRSINSLGNIKHIVWC